MTKNHVVLELEEYNRLRDLSVKTEETLDKMAKEYEEQMREYKRQVADSFNVVKGYSMNVYLDIKLDSEVLADIIHEKVKATDSSLAVNDAVRVATVWDIAYRPIADEEELARLDEEALEQVGEPM